MCRNKATRITEGNGDSTIKEVIERSWLACTSKLKAELGYDFTKINTAEEDKRREDFEMKGQ